MYDITITEIINVFFRDGMVWNRKQFATRRFDAVVFFTEGEIEYYFPEKTIVAKKGDLLYLPGNLPYGGTLHTATASYYVIDFVCASEDAFEHLTAPSVYTPDNADAVLRRFSSVLRHWSRQTVDVNLSVKAFLYSLLSETLAERHAEMPGTLTDFIMQYIVENLGDSSLTVTGLCTRFCISESQLRRNIRKVTGLTPNEYILNLRLNKAKNELTYTEKTIKQIAFDCGFTSQYYFSRCFHKSTALSPSEYRRICWEDQ